jgi:L-rhamnose mutarotase
MQKLHKSIFIQAPREKVWDTMLSDETYREWTSAFHPGSHYRGDWNQGSKIIFVGPGEDGKSEEGMVSRIAESRRPEFVSIEHLGIYKNGVEDTTSDAARQWSPAFENYTFTEKDGGTELTLDQDILEEYKDMFGEMWDKALLKLKEIAER